LNVLYDCWIDCWTFPLAELAAEGVEAVLAIGLATDADLGVASERKGSKIDRVPG
jgi:hypothetical protein